MLIPGTANTFAIRLINNYIGRKKTSRITLINSKDTGLPPELPSELSEDSQAKLSLLPYSALIPELHAENGYDLLVVAVDDWKALFTNKKYDPEILPSVLILKIKN
ncbi:MAG: hypothetical protein IPH45_08905 [Bacteroidales bacterium]|nr:hypothetical protein [Bacteroidales bacterium]